MPSLVACGYRRYRHCCSPSFGPTTSLVLVVVGWSEGSGEGAGNQDSLNKLLGYYGICIFINISLPIQIPLWHFWLWEHLVILEILLRSLIIINNNSLPVQIPSWHFWLGEHMLEPHKH